MDKTTFHFGRRASALSVRLVSLAMLLGLVLATVGGSAQASAAYALTSRSATVHVKCGRTTGVALQGFTFSPSTVDEGGTAVLDETVSNCSGRTFAGSIQTSGKDVCLIVDPVRQAVTLQRHRSVTLTMTYTVPECTGTGTITGQLLSHAGQQIATREASFQSVVPPPTPTIVANPTNVMVDTATTLTGTDFPANATLTIKECSRTTWIVPQDPSATSNVTTVATNANGQFHAKMTAAVCPSTQPTPVATPGFVQNCYVGEPLPQGIDTMALVGATAITVTGP